MVIMMQKKKIISILTSKEEEVERRIPWVVATSVSRSPRSGPTKEGRPWSKLDVLGYSKTVWMVQSYKNDFPRLYLSGVQIW